MSRLRFNPLLSLWVYQVVSAEIGPFTGHRVPRRRLQWALSIAQKQLEKFNWDLEQIRQCYYQGKRLTREGYDPTVKPESKKRGPKPDLVRQTEIQVAVAKLLSQGCSKRAAWRQVAAKFRLSWSAVRKVCEPGQLCT